LSGVALAQAPNVIDNFKLPTNSGPTDNNSECTDCCGTELTPEVIKQTQRMLEDGTWDRGRFRLHGDRGIETQYVKVTIHIVRYSNGTGGIPLNRITDSINDLNTHVASTGLEFFQHGSIIYLDSDEYAECTSDEANALRQIDPVAGSVNIWFVPICPDFCGRASYPYSSVQGIIVENDCVASSWNDSTFSHEVGHYFHLFHTHETFYGAECVDGSNCPTAGDLICDTSADPNLSGLVTSSCVYKGTATDTCHSDPYSPPVHNMMSYSQKLCRDFFTSEQLSIFLWSAENEREDHLLPSGACCNESDSCLNTHEYMCEDVGWNWLGIGTICADGCLQNTPGACCVDTNGGCIHVTEAICLSGSGSFLGPNTLCSDGGCKPSDCDGDTDDSGIVDVGDLLIVIDQWGLSDSPADINQDGIVDVSDLLIVVGNWGACP